MYRTVAACNYRGYALIVCAFDFPFASLPQHYTWYGRALDGPKALIGTIKTYPLQLECQDAAKAAVDAINFADGRFDLLPDSFTYDRDADSCPGHSNIS